MNEILSIINSSAWQYGFAFGIIVAFVPNIIKIIVNFILQIIR